MAPETRIQLRPAVRLNVADLPYPEQDHVRISLRVIAAQLPVPCEIVAGMDADITLKPCTRGPDKLCLVTDTGERHIDRPLRLTPFSDALSSLMDGMLSTPSSVRKDETNDLFMLLTTQSQSGPRRVRLVSGDELLVAGGRQMAKVPATLGTPPAGGLRSAIALSTPMLAGEWSRDANVRGEYIAITSEQLCWWLSAEDCEAVLQPWLDETDRLLVLTTWPNLSHQPDALEWIAVLTDLSREPQTSAQFLRRAVDAGIPLARARQGLALLPAFRHLRQRAPFEQEEGVAARASMDAAGRRQSAPRGLLDRLRSRLRALTGKGNAA